MEADKVLSILERLRKEFHRQIPTSRLRTLKEAHRFIEEVGVITLTSGHGLPSLFGAIEGRPYKPGSKGFALWPAEQWWWGGELAKSKDILVAKIIGGRELYISKRLWPILDQIIRTLKKDIDNRGRAWRSLSPIAKRIYEHLRRKGPTRTDLLRRRLGLTIPKQGKSFHRAKNELESKGILLSEAVEMKELGRHAHIGRLSLWTHRFPHPLMSTTQLRKSFSHDVSAFLEACLDAAVLVEEKTASKWLAWSREESKQIFSSLIKLGRVIRLTHEGKTYLATKKWMNSAIHKQK